MFNILLSSVVCRRRAPEQHFVVTWRLFDPWKFAVFFIANVLLKNQHNNDINLQHPGLSNFHHNR